MFVILKQSIISTMNISEILNAPNDPFDPKPVNQARDFYAACTDTSKFKNSFIKN